ncbi:uncharacterized protein [Spinacia oleracea]|uniref:CCHC-type domain-containing protein n=1 Tax=Spinacia oleracea TaxID=3562 RepID=A0ABM3QQ18_SPIOL|nr:uncharacterized protein LOC130461392 [Spinacia oleracea]
MGDLMKRQFNVLDLSGHNFLEWTVDAQMNLKAQGLDHTIKDIMVPGITEIKTATEQEKAKATVLIRHHLHDSLKTEYLMVENPKELWDSLKERYGHHKRVLLPKAQFDWTNLKFQDFKCVSEYNSTLFKIVSLLRYCDQAVTEDQMIEKTLSTFHANNILLQQQYRERGFKRYSELISLLLVAEQNNDLLLKNHNLRPTGSMAFNEANAVESSNPPEANVAHRGGRGRFNHRGRGRGNHRGRGRGRGRGYLGPRNNNHKGHQQGNQKHTPSKEKDTCFRCGMTGHWGKTCRTAKHLVDLYQASIKGKGKVVEANYVDEENPSGPSFDVSDFFNDNPDSGNDLIFGDNSNI